MKYNLIINLIMVIVLLSLQNNNNPLATSTSTSSTTTTTTITTITTTNTITTSITTFTSTTSTTTKTTTTTTTTITTTTTRIYSVNSSCPFSYSTSSTISPQTTTAGQIYFGGYFSLKLISYDSLNAYYQLSYTYVVKRSLSSYQTCCDSNTILSLAQIGFSYSSPDFAVSCKSGCKSAASNSTILGYMGGVCNTFSVDKSFSVITSTYNVVGDLNLRSFVITSMPQNTTNLDWSPLTRYFDNHNGFKYRLYNSMVPRIDTKLLNSPPIVVASPVFAILSGVTGVRWIQIPVLDSNEDLVLCMYQ